jgi:hypothetical protein
VVGFKLLVSFMAAKLSRRDDCFHNWLILVSVFNPIIDCEKPLVRTKAIVTAEINVNAIAISMVLFLFDFIAFVSFVNLY